ncbi:hypothetical protein ACFXTN_017689 [Malus domestica]
MASGSTCPRLDIHKATGRPKRLIKPSSNALRRLSQTKRASGQTSSQVFCRHIAPPKGEQPVKTPFSLAYGSEAITSPNVVVPNISTVLPNLEQNEKKMATNLDLAVECLQPEKVLRVISHHSLDHVQDEKV